MAVLVTLKLFTTIKVDVPIETYAEEEYVAGEDGGVMSYENYIDPLEVQGAVLEWVDKNSQVLGDCDFEVLETEICGDDD